MLKQYTLLHLKRICSILQDLWVLYVKWSSTKKYNLLMKVLTEKTSFLKITLPEAFIIIRFETRLYRHNNFQAGWSDITLFSSFFLVPMGFGSDILQKDERCAVATPRRASSARVYCSECSSVLSRWICRRYTEDHLICKMICWHSAFSSGPWHWDLSSTLIWSSIILIVLGTVWDGCSISGFGQEEWEPLGRTGVFFCCLAGWFNCLEFSCLSGWVLLHDLCFEAWEA